LAKHRPKKKYTPEKPASDDPEKKDIPPTEPVVSDVATFIFEPFEGEERRWVSIGFMITIFIASIMIAKGMGMRLPKSDRKKIVTQAIGSYVFLYLFMWILTYTIVNVLSSESGFSTPFT